MIDIDYAKLATYLMVATVLAQVLIAVLIVTWRSTRDLIDSAKLRKRSRLNKLPCGATFHCHCDEDEGPHVVHVSREHLIAWRD